MMATEYVQRVVSLETSDYQAVRRCAEEKGLGGKGFSAALRLIIREWQAYCQSDPRLPHPQSQIPSP